MWVYLSHYGMNVRALRIRERRGCIFHIIEQMSGHGGHLPRESSCKHLKLWNDVTALQIREKSPCGCIFHVMG